MHPKGYKKIGVIPMADKLKPCPFCNGEGEIVKTHLYGKVSGYFASCKKCGCQLKAYTSRQGAEKSWNRRKSDD